ncbi:MAG: hypothetical protein ACHQEB_07235 [Chitinophagales bacterium]
MASGKSIKEQIIREIELLPAPEQQTVLGLVENYLHNKADETEWDQLPEIWKKRIAESLQQADNSQFILHEDAVKYLRKKYGLNG